MSYGSIGGGGFSETDDSREQQRLLERCSQNAKQLDANVKELERLHSQLIGGRPAGGPQSVTDAIRQKEQATNRLLAASAELMRQLAGLHSADSLLNTRRGRLLGQYKSCVARYRQLQERIVTSVRSIAEQQQEQQEQQEQQQRRRLQEAGGEQSPFAAQDQLQARAELGHMQQQEQQMRGLLDDIVQIEEMFKDVSAMVYEQGEAIDDIANNITSAAENAEQGERQLSDAVVYRRKARKKKICLAVIVLVVLAVLGLVLYLSLKK